MPVQQILAMQHHTEFSDIIEKFKKINQILEKRSALVFSTVSPQGTKRKADSELELERDIKKTKTSQAEDKMTLG